MKATVQINDRYLKACELVAGGTKYSRMFLEIDGEHAVIVSTNGHILVAMRWELDERWEEKPFWVGIPSNFFKGIQKGSVTLTIAKDMVTMEQDGQIKSAKTETTNPIHWRNAVSHKEPTGEPAHFAMEVMEILRKLEKLLGTQVYLAHNGMAPTALIFGEPSLNDFIFGVVMPYSSTGKVDQAKNYVAPAWAQQNRQGESSC